LEERNTQRGGHPSEKKSSLNEESRTCRHSQSEKKEFGKGKFGRIQLLKRATEKERVQIAGPKTRGIGQQFGAGEREARKIGTGPTRANGKTDSTQREVRDN